VGSGEPRGFVTAGAQPLKEWRKPNYWRPDFEQLEVKGRQA